MFTFYGVNEKMCIARHQWAVALGATLVASLVLGISGTANGPQEETRSAELSKASTEQETETDDFPPVDSMHHFMEYISQPAYRQLKEVLAEEPKDRRAWKAVKSPALVLAETSSLVAARMPEGLTEEQAKQWKQISIDVYKSATALYKSSGDYEKAKENYSVMIDNCNRCHTEFENGRHQLEK